MFCLNVWYKSRLENAQSRDQFFKFCEGLFKDFRGYFQSGSGLKMASELSIKFIHGSINRDQLEKLYTKKWRQELGKRVFWGRQIQKFMGQNFLSEFAVQSLQKMPFLFPSIIKLTHGNVID